MIDPKIQSMIRVDQAGEYGATKIYQGQMAVLGKTPTLEAMAAQEAEHLKHFNDLAIRYQVRPTVLQPLWSVLGFALGAVTAALGEKTAHACTIAVETEIDQHYQEQLKQLKSEKDSLTENLYTLIEKCHADEVAHKEEARHLGGEEAPFYPVLSGVIRASTRLAIWLSKRI